MAEFNYQGRNAKGELTQGKVEASSQEEAAKKIIEMGTTPLRIEAIKKKRDWSALLNIEIIKAKASREDLAVLCRQLLSLYKANVPLSLSMARLSQMSRKTVVREALESVAKDLEAGRSLSDSMQKHPGVFSPLFCNIIRVGENTGRLDDALTQLSAYLELEDVTAKRMKSVMRYPIIVVTAIVIAFVVINIFVIPAFAQFFSKYGAELPWATRLLLGMSNFMLVYWVYLLGAVVILVVSLIYFKSTKVGHYYFDQLKLRLPIIGKTFQKIMFARFSRMFAMIIRTGLSLPRGLELVAAAVGNDVVSERILQMRDSITRGESMLKSAMKVKIFSPMVLQMLSVGEEAGTLDQMLDYVAEFYEQEVDYDLRKFKDAIEPLLLVFIGGMVLILALGVFLPMWSLSRVVQGG